MHVFKCVCSSCVSRIHSHESVCTHTRFIHVRTIHTHMNAHTCAGALGVHLDHASGDIHKGDEYCDKARNLTAVHETVAHLEVSVYLVYSCV